MVVMKVASTVDMRAETRVAKMAGQLAVTWVYLKVAKDKKMVDLMDVKLVCEKDATRVDLMVDLMVRLEVD